MELLVQELDTAEYEQPVLDTVEDERAHRKVRLAAALRIFATFGYDHGPAGHITVRDPEHPECFWVNPLSVPFARVRVSDLLLVNEHGEVVHGRRPVNRAAFAIHSQIHAARPDALAAAHAHSPGGMAWSTLGRTLLPLTQDACAFYEDHVVFQDYAGIVIETDEGKRIAADLAGSKAAILRNHGLLTVGDTLESAVWWFVQMERCCQVQLAAEAAGSPVPIDPEMARLTASQVGTPLAGWISAKPLFDRVLAEQPDLRD